MDPPLPCYDSDVERELEALPPYEFEKDKDAEEESRALKSVYNKSGKDETRECFHFGKVSGELQSLVRQLSLEKTISLCTNHIDPLPTCCECMSNLQSLVASFGGADGWRAALRKERAAALLRLSTGYSRVEAFKPWNRKFLSGGRLGLFMGRYVNGAYEDELGEMLSSLSPYTSHISAAIPRKRSSFVCPSLLHDELTNENINSENNSHFLVNSNNDKQHAVRKNEEKDCVAAVIEETKDQKETKDVFWAYLMSSTPNEEIEDNITKNAHNNLYGHKLSLSENAAHEDLTKIDTKNAAYSDCIQDCVYPLLPYSNFCLKTQFAKRKDVTNANDRDARPEQAEEETNKILELSLQILPAKKKSLRVVESIRGVCPSVGTEQAATIDSALVAQMMAMGFSQDLAYSALVQCSANVVKSIVLAFFV